MKRRISGHDVHLALPYNATVREWIHDLKFGRLLTTRDREALLRLARHVLAQDHLEDFEAVVAVPSHPLRSLLQVDLSWEWAACVSEASGRPLLPRVLSHASLASALLRAPQKFAAPEERRAAHFESGCRFVARANERPRRLLLVDDVVNTGCTLFAARNALRRAGHEVRAQLALASP